MTLTAAYIAPATDQPATPMLHSPSLAVHHLPPPHVFAHPSSNLQIASNPSPHHTLAPASTQSLHQAANCQIVHNGAKQCTFQISPATPNTADPTADLQPHAPLTPPDPPLSSAQLAALPLILAGKSDTEVARTLGFHRNTINRWRTLELPFMARLNRMRASQDAQALDAIRAELPTAAATLIHYLTHGFAADRIRAATNLLRLAAVHRRLHNIGPQTVPELLQARTSTRRSPKRTRKAKPNSITPAPASPPDLRHILAQQLAQELALEAPHELPEPPAPPKPKPVRCPSPWSDPNAPARPHDDD